MVGDFSEIDEVRESGQKAHNLDAIRFFQDESVRGGVHGVHPPNLSVKKKLKCAKFEFFSREEPR